MNTVEQRSIIPGPRGRFLVGNRYDYERDRAGFLLGCQQRYGDVFRFDADTVVALDPELTHEVFTDTNTRFVELRTGSSTEVLARQAGPWMLMRRRSGRGLGRGMLISHAQRMDEGFISGFRAAAGRELDSLEFAQMLCGGAAAEFCFFDGGGEVAYKNGMWHRLVLAGNEQDERIPRWLPTVQRRRRDAVGRDSFDQLVRYVAARMSQPRPDNNRDVVDMVLDPQSGPPLSATEAARVIRIALSTAYGVPGAALVWIMRELALRPEMMAKVRTESTGLPHAIGSADPHLLPYTLAVVRELLRVYPPIWLVGRYAAAATSLGGWTLRRGERVLLSPYLIHRDHRWWRDPGQVRPERWMDTQHPCKPNMYIPFGGGPRVCLGARISLLQLTIATARLAEGYDIELVNASTAAAAHNVLLVPAGLRARLIPRAHSGAARTVKGGAGDPLAG